MGTAQVSGGPADYSKLGTTAKFELFLSGIKLVAPSNVSRMNALFRRLVSLWPSGVPGFNLGETSRARGLQWIEYIPEAGSEILDTGKIHSVMFAVARQGSVYQITDIGFILSDAARTSHLCPLMKPIIISDEGECNFLSKTLPLD